MCVCVRAPNSKHSTVFKSKSKSILINKFGASLTMSFSTTCACVLCVLCMFLWVRACVRACVCVCGVIVCACDCVCVSGGKCGLVCVCVRAFV